MRKRRYGERMGEVKLRYDYSASMCRASHFVLSLSLSPLSHVGLDLVFVCNKLAGNNADQDKTNTNRDKDKIKTKTKPRPRPRPTKTKTKTTTTTEKALFTTDTCKNITDICATDTLHIGSIGLKLRYGYSASMCRASHFFLSLSLSLSLPLYVGLDLATIHAKNVTREKYLFIFFLSSTWCRICISDPFFYRGLYF
jgi:hypothetical protein